MKNLPYLIVFLLLLACACGYAFTDCCFRYQLCLVTEPNKVESFEYYSLFGKFFFVAMIVLSVSAILLAIQYFTYFAVQIIKKP